MVHTCRHGVVIRRGNGSGNAKVQAKSSTVLHTHTPSDSYRRYVPQSPVAVECSTATGGTGHSPVCRNVQNSLLQALLSICCVCGVTRGKAKMTTLYCVVDYARRSRSMRSLRPEVSSTSSRAASLKSSRTIRTIATIADATKMPTCVGGKGRHLYR